MELLNVGVDYLQVGLSVIPVKMPTKQPLFSWKEFQQRLISPEDLSAALTPLNGNGGLALVCGRISGNLEVIDFDNKFDLAEAVFTSFIGIKEVHDIIVQYSIPYEKTFSGGYHLFIRSKKIDGNKKLASITKNGKTETIIETRGEGGYVVCDPTSGYKLIYGSLQNIPLLSVEDRDILLAHCRSFGEIKETSWRDIKFERHKEVIHSDEIKQILLDAGWTYVSSSNENDHYRRPGKKRGVSASYNGKVFYVFSTNCSPFQSEKGYNNFQVFTLLKHGGVIAHAERELLDRKLLMPQEIEQRIEEIDHFILSRIGKNSGLPEIKGDHGDFIKYLAKHGFRRFDLSCGFKIVRVVDNVVYDVQLHHLRDFCLRGLDGAIDEDEKKSYLIKNDNNYFNENKLSFLPVFAFEFNNDTKDKAFFYFKDYYLQITADSIEPLEYSNLGSNVIWHDQIIPFEYAPKAESEDHSSIFDDFLKKITRFDKDSGRYYSLISAIGYLLNSYKNPSVAKAIVLCDEGNAGNLSPDASQGRTGKSLIGKAISKVRKTTFEDGRNFNFDQFAFQNLQLSTQVHFFNDCSKRFQFENLFSVITEGYTVNKKNQQPFEIPFEHAPKILVATNFTFQTDDESSRDRIFEIELAPFYSAKHKPIDDFGKLFWNDFDPVEWRNFFVNMALYTSYYLKFGLVTCLPINLAQRKLLQAVPEEFIDFVESYFEQLNPDIDGTVRVYKELVTNIFAEKFPRFKGFSQKVCTKWLKKYLETNQIDFEENRNNKDGKFFLIKSLKKVSAD